MSLFKSCSGLVTDILYLAPCVLCNPQGTKDNFKVIPRTRASAPASTSNLLSVEVSLFHTMSGPAGGNDHRDLSLVEQTFARMMLMSPRQYGEQCLFTSGTPSLRGRMSSLSTCSGPRLKYENRSYPACRTMPVQVATARSMSLG